MKTVIEKEDIVEAIRNDHIGVKDLFEVFEWWSQQQSVLGYETKNLKLILGNLKNEIDNLSWVGHLRGVSLDEDK